jgi:hypothetical protein
VIEGDEDPTDYGPDTYTVADFMDAFEDASDDECGAANLLHLATII